MGERTPPKTRGFWISFWSISMRWKKVPQGIGHGPALAAADVAGREHWQFYRFKRLSNRALAAAGRKCRCGPLGRKIRQASAPPRGARERQRGWGYKRFVVRRSAYILVFAGYTAAFYDAVSRAGSLETCGFKQHFWSLLGLRPKVTCARGRGIFPLLGTWRKHERAVGDAGPYGVRHCRAVRGSGSGSYRRVPGPVIARHPRGARERQRG